ncbi:MAG: type 4a pilus biogenesis protein PilO [Candidatus Omnitrophica bacterium]|nr:type 4a pilus biogenesis protein PilO [Candidatus Omnitrophota bacterium]
MISKFISGLSPIEKKFLIITVVFVFLALFDRLLLGPNLARLNEIDENIVKEESVVKQNKHFLTYRDRIVKEAGVFKDFYAKDVRAEEEVIGEFLKKIELMATQSQVELSKISPAGQEYQKDYIKYFVTLDCSGKLEDITNFIYAVNNSKDLLKIEKMNMLGNNRDAEKVQVALTISRMIIGADPSADPKSLVKIKQDAAVPVPAQEKK